MERAKKHELVKLLSNDYRGIKKGDYGVVLTVVENKSEVMFFSDYNIGDYAAISIKNEDLEVANERLPRKLIIEISRIFSDRIFKNAFDEMPVKEYDVVELLVDDAYYKKHGVKKGDRGIVVIDYAVQGSILVDFTRVLPDGECIGDCISVDIKDLKVVTE